MTGANIYAAFRLCEQEFAEKTKEIIKAAYAFIDNTDIDVEERLELFYDMNLGSEYEYSNMPKEAQEVCKKSYENADRLYQRIDILERMIDGWYEFDCEEEINMANVIMKCRVKSFRT